MSHSFKPAEKKVSPSKCLHVLVTPDGSVQCTRCSFTWRLTDAAPGTSALSCPRCHGGNTFTRPDSDDTDDSTPASDPDSAGRS